jgi:hypothetical protein
MALRIMGFLEDADRKAQGLDDPQA